MSEMRLFDRLGEDRLPQLRSEVVELLSRIALATRNLAVDHIALGERLSEAKLLLGHGRWLPFLREINFSEDKAQRAMQMAQPEVRRMVPLKGDMNPYQYMRMYRHAVKLAHKETRKEALAQLVKEANTKPSDMWQCHHSDCRQFDWPKTVDCIGTDPPWDDMDAYRWLGEFAFSHLPDGGLAIVQVSKARLFEAVNALARGGLTYRWLCMITFRNKQTRFMDNLPVGLASTPVMLFSKGTWDTKGLNRCSDTWTVDDVAPKNHHPWEQPLLPFQQWIRRWTRLGSLIVDPFCGSGTVGVACKTVGGMRRFIGTEIDKDFAKVARANINKAVASSFSED